MKIRVQSIHFDADSKLLQFVQDKVDKLLQFYDHIIGGEVFLKIDKASDNKNKIVQIKIQVPGNDILAKEQCRTF
ncbi:MAG TPA: HPF/RaiA family ribosome-associated protein, partial [Bacteroidia bacterium]|nr:HPF/RaiA family ribosome-associated protein [Bacteroidia bacterium]